MKENKKGQISLKVDLSFFCCPTWIRTKTNRTKICRTTIILSGNQKLISQFASLRLSPKGVQK